MHVAIAVDNFRKTALIYMHARRIFTPELITWYNNFKMGPNGHLLDIIFISSDEDVESWKEYSSKMPWYGLHFNDEKMVNTGS